MSTPIDFTSKTVRIDMVNDTYSQSTNTCGSAALHRKLQFVRIERGAPGIIKITYWDSFQLQYVIKTVQNKDENDNIKQSFAGPITRNAKKLKLYRGVSDSLTAKADEKALVEILPEAGSDLAWKSTVRFYGVRDALMGSVPFAGKSPY